ncbi:MAG: YebC/PmpR family DNA-binding transcriptional regulator [Bacteroidetes bacterium]|nr:MAG: YebC/PmpR family DNA-binding transcriptional regulator [Bacteroidota bacterium]
MGRAFEFRKARKMKRWSYMAKTFTKIGREIVVAVKAGGADLSSNSRLRLIIQNAKSVNMPKETVERAIKKASSKDQEDYKEIVYEGYAPFGIGILVECMSDNINRTVANVRSYFTRAGGTLGTSGSLDFLFERKCIFKILDKNYNLEELEFELIDFGVEELFKEEEHLVLSGDFTDFGKIQKALEDKEIEIISANLERIPTDTKELTAEQEEAVEKLLAKFEEDEDVQSVFHNMR